MPEKFYEDSEENSQIFNEMWTGDQWWKLQVRSHHPSAKELMYFMQDKLIDGATIAPVIITLDKTQLLTSSGDKSAWLVYLTIENIAKSVQCSLSA